LKSYLRHKAEFDKVLKELVDAGGRKRFSPAVDYVQIGHLRHMNTLGFVVELVNEFAVTFEITEAGREMLGVK